MEMFLLDGSEHSNVLTVFSLSGINTAFASVNLTQNRKWVGETDYGILRAPRVLKKYRENSCCPALSDLSALSVVQLNVQIYLGCTSPT